MDFYAKVEPGGEFVTGIIDKRDYEKDITKSDIFNIIMDDSRENDIVRGYGLPMLMGNGIKDSIDDAKESVLGQFSDMPEEGRDKINWEIEYREAKTCPPFIPGTSDEDPSMIINAGTDDEGTAVYSFVFSEYSKYSVDMDFGADVDLSKLSIRLTFCSFHTDEFPDDANESADFWILEGIEYEGENDDYETPEWEMLDRGIDSHYVLVDHYQGENIEMEEE